MNLSRSVLLAITHVWLLSACAMQPAERAAQDLTSADTERLIVITVRNDGTVIAPRAGSTARAYGPRSQYAIAPAAQAHARALATSYRLREVTAWPIGLLGVHCLVYEIPANADRAAILDRLRRDPRVESAQPLQSFRTLTNSYNDPYHGLQRNLDAMNVVAAHRWSRGEGIRIAIIDTGVDVKHPDLAGRIAKSEDFVGSSRGRRNSNRHGTAIAGIIGAVGDNDQGIVGIAPAAKLYALRACWTASGSTGAATCNTLTLAKALVAAIDARTHIVNLSLGGPADPLLGRLVKTGIQHGILFVGATPPADQRDTFPTGIPGVIGVDILGNAANADAALFAPGEEVLTLAPNGSYDFLSGSSLAAASISGGIALLLARDKSIGLVQVRALLADSSRHSTENAAVDLCVALTDLLQKGSCD